MNISSRKRASGFTLIELLVVIAIIALLTGIVLTNLTGSKAKSRDAKRASDLAQIQLAIEQYFGRCNQYPTALDLSKTDGCPSGVSLGSFISVLPKDPVTSALYGYVTNHDTDPTDYPVPTDYVLYTTFEATNSVLGQSAPDPSWLTSGYSGYFNCLNQATTPSLANGLGYCVRPN